MQKHYLLLSFIAAFSPSILSACTTSASVQGKLRPRAAFDLGCPAAELKLSVLSGSGGSGISSYGVEGCGQRARYETMCSTGGTNCIIELEGAGDSARKKAALDEASRD